MLSLWPSDLARNIPPTCCSITLLKSNPCIFMYFACSSVSADAEIQKTLIEIECVILDMESARAPSELNGALEHDGEKRKVVEIILGALIVILGASITIYAYLLQKACNLRNSSCPDHSQFIILGGLILASGIFAVLDGYFRSPRKSSPKVFFIPCGVFVLVYGIFDMLSTFELILGIAFVALGLVVIVGGIFSER